MSLNTSGSLASAVRDAERRRSSVDHGLDRGESASTERRLVALMDRYEGPVHAYLMAILHDRDAALDCAQDTFVRGFEALRKGKDINAKWLYTVAHNRAVDEFRRTKRLQSDAHVHELQARNTSVERALDVEAVMTALPPVDREVLYLFEVAGFKTDEIGAMLGVRGSAIRQRLARARQRFRSLYEMGD